MGIALFGVFLLFANGLLFLGISFAWEKIVKIKTKKMEEKVK